MDTTYKKECSICGNLTYWSSIEGYDEYIKSSNWCKKFICRRCKEDVLLKNFNLKIIKYMTKEQQKGEAYEEYEAKCAEIDEQEEDIKIIDGKRYRLID